MRVTNPDRAALAAGGACSAGIALVRHLTGGYFLMSLDLPSSFAAPAPGQFVMVRPPGRYPLLARPLSIHDYRRAGRASRVELLVREAGEGTRALGVLGRGGRVTVWGPLGRGFSVSAPGRRIMVAGGRGIAPMWFLSRRILDEAGNDRPAIDLFYGACTSDELHYVDEFRAAGVKVHVATEDGSRGYKGLVTSLLKEKLGVRRRPPRPGKKEKAATQLGMFEAVAEPGAGAPPPEDLIAAPFFQACGPTPMMRAVHDAAAAMRARCEVSLESHMACGIGACLGCAHRTAAGGLMHVCREGPVVDSHLVFAPAGDGGAAA